MFKTEINKGNIHFTSEHILDLIYYVICQWTSLNKQNISQHEANIAAWVKTDLVKWIGNNAHQDKFIEELTLYIISEWISVEEKNEPDHEVLVNNWIDNTLTEWLIDKCRAKV